MVLVNVITRTSNRPLFFCDCVASVRGQTHRPVRHIVGADDDPSLAYARALIPDAVRVDAPGTEAPPRANDAAYNLYLNTLMQQVAEGWIMFLDDDDAFVDENSLAAIAAHATDEDRVLLWRVQFPGWVLPSESFGKVPLLGDVTGAGVMFHAKHRRHAQWDAVKGSDHRVIERLFLLLKPYWIDAVLTRVNYDPATPNFAGGRGERRDKAQGLNTAALGNGDPIWPMSELRALRRRLAALEAELKSGTK